MKLTNISSKIWNVPEELGLGGVMQTMNPAQVLRVLKTNFVSCFSCLSHSHSDVGNVQNYRIKIAEITMTMTMTMTMTRRNKNKNQLLIDPSGTLNEQLLIWGKCELPLSSIVKITYVRGAGLTEHRQLKPI